MSLETSHNINMPLVSIVLPCFKQARLLPEALDSILAQDYPYIETIVVNDGSPDDTVEVARSFIEANPGREIRIVEKENGGVSDARNAGLRVARGQYLMCLDADDKIKSKYVSTALSLMSRTKANLFYCNQENFGTETGEWITGPYSPYFIRYSNCICNVAIYDRILFERTGGYKVSFAFAEDWEYWISCSRHGLIACKGEEKLYQYRVNSGGLAATFMKGHYKDCTALIRIANEDLYPVEELLEAHDHVPALSSEAQRILEDLDRKHSEQWLLKFCLGLIAEQTGNISEAMKYYWLSVALTSEKNWQPFFRIGVLSEKAEQGEEALRFYRLTLTLRPDMSRFLLPRIVALGGVSPL
ncbi:MAG: glycosyltransferase [SAR324 cluster bacterium]|uniref:Glycosyltransferase n=1 Tax=SAR324 cluster bacterium TaxID=2024889 RepID=A0A7X9FQH3_9DELT|nr:glycosyltransferase [SAR324 cluster bacterium]